MADRRIHSGDDIDSGNIKLQVVENIITYSNAAGSGAIGTVDLFIVTGLVKVYDYTSQCLVDIVGAATLDVGTANDDDMFTPNQLADASLFDADDVWVGSLTTAESNGVTGGTANDQRGSFLENVTIIQTVGAANITAGKLKHKLIWAALEPGSTIVPA